MKEKIEKILKNKVVRFLIVGGCSTALDFIIYYFLSLKISVVISKIVSMLISSLLSYFLNKLYTFEVKRKTNIGFLVRFYITFAANMSVNVSVNTLLYYITGYKLISYAVGTLCGLCVNFVMQKFFVFNSRNDKDD